MLSPARASLHVIIINTPNNNTIALLRRGACFNLSQIFDRSALWREQCCARVLSSATYVLTLLCKMRAVLLTLLCLTDVSALVRASPGRVAATPRFGAASAYLGEIPQGPPDAILGIAAAFRASAADDKVNVCVGAYRDDVGVPYVLPSVTEAERRLLERGEKKEYAPIEGLAEFRQRALEFAYGEDCGALKEGRIAGVQTLSGTGACRIAGEFYARFLPRAGKG